MNSFKRIVTKGLVRLYASPVLGNIAAAVTSAGVAYLGAKVPFVFEGIEFVVRLSTNIPPETELTTAGVATFLSPFVFGALKAGIQEILFRSGNQVLETLADYGLYEGKKDGWTGPVARESIHQLILTRHDIPDPDR